MKRKTGRIAAAALFWLLIWQLLCSLVGQEILLPAPISVAKRIAQLSLTGTFWKSVALSLLRILLGFVLALAVGTVLGAASARFAFLDTLVSPAIQVIRATPVASFIILLFVFLSKNRIPVVTAFLMVLPVVWSNVYEGVKRLDPQLLEMASVFKMSRGTVLRHICLPGVMPFFLAAAKTGMGLAWKAGIAAEVLACPTLGIGRALYDAKIYLESVDLFAWTAVIIVISILLEKAFLFVIGRTYDAA